MDKNLTAKLEKLTKVQKLLIVAGTLVVIGALAGYFLLWPNWSKASQLKDDVATLTRKIGSLQGRAAQLQQVMAERDLVEQQFDRIKTLMPQTSEGMWRLQADIESLANENNVRFLMFLPSNQEDMTLYAAKKSIQVHLQGNYNNIMRVIDGLNGLPRMVVLDTVLITSSSAGGQRGAQQQPVLGSQVKAEVTFWVYRALTPEEVEMVKMEQAQAAAKDKK